MALLPSGKREQTMVAVVMFSALLAVVFYMYVFAPKAEELSTVRAHVDSLESANAKARSAIVRGSVKELQDEARRYEENLTLMRRLVPTGNEVPALLEQVSTAARQAGLEIASVEPQPVLPGDDFDTYRYRISVKGQYHQIGELLANVGSLTRIVTPIDLHLLPAPSTPGAAADKSGRGTPQAVLKSEFEIQTYVAHTGAPVRKQLEARRAPGEQKS
jgi:type IV pilus assembly protein PilO